MFAEEEVSLDTQNALLALVAYHGLGSGWATTEDAMAILKSHTDLTWWPAGKDHRTPRREGEGGGESVSDGTEGGSRASGDMDSSGEERVSGEGTTDTELDGATERGSELLGGVELSDVSV